MRTTIFAILSLVSQLLLLSPVFADESAQKILVTNVHIFNGIDAERLMNANVLIDGPRIFPSGPAISQTVALSGTFSDVM